MSDSSADNEWQSIAQGVKERIAEGDGFWKSCSGCLETEDGQNIHGYPHSTVFGCDLGSGCSECGGIGAVWDSTAYGQMADEMHAEMVAEEAAKVSDNVPQESKDTRNHGETYRLGMDAAFNEVADYLQEQKLYAYAEHIRQRASLAVPRPEQK